MKNYLNVALIWLIAHSNLFGQATVNQYDKFEIDVSISSLSTSDQALINAQNPFQMDEIQLIADFTAPDQTISTVYGFWNADCIISDDTNSSHRHSNWPNMNHQEISEATNKRWSIRFSPELIGTYTYAIRFYLPATATVINIPSTGQFTCSSSSSPGFVGLDNNGFHFSNGERHYPVGINLFHHPDWEDYSPKLNFYQTYIDQMKLEGLNTIRITANHVGSQFLVGAEYDNANDCRFFLRTYDLRDAHLIDKIVEYAQSNDIQIHWRIFANTSLWGDNYFESRNTYFEQLSIPNWCEPQGYGGDPDYFTTGGPMIQNRDEFFTNSQASSLQDSYVRYILNRWGYSRSISVWEVFAECDVQELTQTGLNAIPEWNEEKVNLIRTYDIYERPITTSFLGLYRFDPANPSPETDFYGEILDDLDFIELHRYTSHIRVPEDPDDVADAIAQYDFRQILFKELKRLKLYGQGDKFIALTESGNYGTDEAPDYYLNEDPHGIAYHELLWSSLMQGICAPPFDWAWRAYIDRFDQNHPATAYMSYLENVNDFRINLGTFATADQSLYEIKGSENDNLSAYYFEENGRVVGWLQDDAYSMWNMWDFPNDEFKPQYADYFQSLDPADAPARMSTTNSINLTLPTSGAYKIEWFNTKNSNLEVVENVIYDGSGEITLTIPSELMDSPFGDAAFIISPSCEGWSEDHVSTTGNTVLEGTKMEFSNNQMQLFYVRNDGKFHAIYETTNDSWTDNWINVGPSMKSGSNYCVGFDVVPEYGNEIYYAAYDQRIYRLQYLNGAWTYNSTSNDAKVRRDSELHFGKNDNVFYVDNSSSKMAVMYPNGGSSWGSSLLDQSAPTVQSGSGFCVHQDWGNRIYYISAVDQRIYELYWSSGWTNTVTNSAVPVRSDSRLAYGMNDQLFFVNPNNEICALSKDGGNWSYHILNSDAPEVLTGSFFDLLPDQNNTIYYTSSAGNIVKLQWDSNDGWLYEHIYISEHTSGGAKNSHGPVYSENNMFYVGLNDDRVHRLQYVYTVPFKVNSTTVDKVDNWDLNYTDYDDVAFKFVIAETMDISATIDFPSTLINQGKLQVFDENGTSMAYQYVGGNTVVLNVQLTPGKYYIVVDGYDQGEFTLAVDGSIVKSKLQEVSLNETTSFTNMRIYPNPANNEVSVLVDKTDNWDFRCFDLNGNLVLQSQFSGSSETINLENLSNGLYIIQLISDNERLNSKLVIAR